MARADDRNRFLGGEEAVLVEQLVRRQLVADAEQALEIGLRHMAMPGRDIHHQLGRSRLAVALRLAIGLQPVPQGVAHQPFHHAPVKGCGAHA